MVACDLTCPGMSSARGDEKPHPIGIGLRDCDLVIDLARLGCMLMINRQIAPNGRRAEGLRSTPEVFIGMLARKNFGKQIVKLVYGFGRLGA